MDFTRKNFLLSSAAFLGIGASPVLRAANTLTAAPLSSHRKRLLAAQARKKARLEKRMASRKAKRARLLAKRSAKKKAQRTVQVKKDLASVNLRVKNLSTALKMTHAQRVSVSPLLKQQNPKIRAIRLNKTLAASSKATQISAIKRRTRHMIRTLLTPKQLLKCKGGVLRSATKS